MRTKLRGKVTLLFLMLGLLLAVPTVALAADLLTEAELLSSQVSAPTEVAPDDTTNFTIKVWARGNLNNPNATGDAVITKAYTMGVGGITPNSGPGSTTNVKFQTGFQYGTDGQNCPGTVPVQPAGVTGRGCATDPFVIPATLAVGNLADGTDGTLTVVATGSQALDPTNPLSCETSDNAIILPNNQADSTDCTRDQGFVTVAGSNSDPVIDTAAEDANGTEGDTLQASGTFSDADGDTLSLSADNTEGTFDGDNGDGTWSWSLSTNDDVAGGTITVTADDGNGGTVTDVFTYSAANANPSATFTAPDQANEGSNFNLSLSAVQDAGSADTHEYRFDCGDGSGFGAWGTASSAQCSAGAGPNTLNVKGQVRDDDEGLSEEYSDSVSVINVAPTATFGNNGPVNEGSSFNLALNSPSDPSSADTTAGFQYRFDCGDGSGYGSWGAASSTSCSTNDNGNRNVGAEIRDKDLTPVSTYTGTVTVNNVAPTATKDFPSSSVNEGSSFNLALTDPHDPSSADTTAGFTYAFDCGSGYGAFGSSSSTSCSTDDNGNRNVGAKIKDKDDGVTEYTGTVTVNNVPPTITNISASVQNVLSGKNVSFTGTATDPSSVDTTAGFSWQWSKDGGAYAAGSNPFSTSFSTCGSHSVSAKATDKDGGTSDAVSSPNVNVYNASFSPPVDIAPYVNTVQKGRVIPVKISVGCPSGLTGLQPSIQLLNGDQSTGNETQQDEIETYSVSSADTGQVMRAVDGGYIYNLRVPDVANATYTIRVNPFGGSNASSNMYALLKTRK